MSFLKSLFGSKSSASKSKGNNKESNHDISMKIDKIMFLSDPLQQESEIEKLNLNTPGNHDIITQAGFIFSKNKKYERALQYYQEFVKRFKDDSDQALGYYQLGVIYNKMRKFSEAIASHKKAIEIDQYTFISYNGLGDVYFEMKEYKKARDYYLRFYSVKKLQNDLVANQLAAIEFELGNVNLAVKYTQDAIKFNPTQSTYYFNLSHFYEKAGKTLELKKHLKFSCEKFPNDFRLLIQYARVRMRFPNEYPVQETIEYARKALKLNSKDIETRVIYACIVIESIADKWLSGDFTQKEEDKEHLFSASKTHDATLKMNVSKLDEERIFTSLALFASLTLQGDLLEIYRSRAEELKRRRLMN